MNNVANALAQSVDHIVSFFEMLRLELAFYVGCLNLYERLIELGEPLCFPVPFPSGEKRYTVRELYDPCLALTIKSKVVGNDLEASDKDLVIVTGANQGQKINLFAKRRSCPAYDAVRDVRTGGIPECQSLQKVLHPLPTQGRCHHEKWET